ncbi:hypothetical protein AAHA92_21020 [Salvia divinorum]|uniref:Myb/SANT-like domain-containing protein n=1 Tax=Salvia divinorum TaxID=28513 RepID=A0ABD1GJ15_SALDI
MNIPHQAWFLYKGKWFSKIDTILVDTIIRLKGETGWILKEFPSYFLSTSAKEINSKSVVQFTEVELATRIEAMHVRYWTFKEVLGQEGAYWDFSSKCVIADDCVWKKICKKNTFACAYYYHNEPQYTKLACLFGMDDVKVETEKEVIVISETTEKLSSEEPSCYEVGEGNEKVNSLNVFPPPPRVRRKLFIEKDEPSDRESTTEMGIYFIEVGPDGLLRTRLEKGRVFPTNPTPKQDRVGPSHRSSHASSCASNSPMGWWPHLQK